MGSGPPLDVSNSKSEVQRLRRVVVYGLKRLEALQESADVEDAEYPKDVEDDEEVEDIEDGEDGAGGDTRTEPAQPKGEAEPGERSEEGTWILVQSPRKRRYRARP